MSGKPKGSFWTDAKEAMARALWLAGGLTCEEIGERLGCSKNAFCGFKNREKLPPHARRVSAARRAAKAQARAEAVPHRPRFVSPTPALSRYAPAQPADAPTLPRLPSLGEPLRRGRPRAAFPAPLPAVPNCLFPMWRHTERPPRDPLFCGKPAERGSYCIDHANICYLGASP